MAAVAITPPAVAESARLIVTALTEPSPIPSKTDLAVTIRAALRNDDRVE
jgi:hypothetical protein